MSSPAKKILLTSDDLVPLENEVAKLTREIDERVARRDDISAKLQAVYDVVAQVEELGRSPVFVVKPKPLMKPKPVTSVAKVAVKPKRKTAKRESSSAVTWLSEIKRVAADEEMGMTYMDLRAGIDLGPLSERLRTSDKGLYGAMSKLEAAGEIVRHNGRMFDPLVLKEFRRRVAAGEIQDVAPPVAPERPSPMGDAILSFVERHPFGVESGQIAAHLKTIPQFTDVVTKNKTAAYNVIKRLLDRGKIRKVGSKYLPLEKE